MCGVPSRRMPPRSSAPRRRSEPSGPRLASWRRESGGLLWCISGAWADVAWNERACRVGRYLAVKPLTERDRISLWWNWNRTVHVFSRSPVLESRSDTRTDQTADSRAWTAAGKVCVREVEGPTQIRAGRFLESAHLAGILQGQGRGVGGASISDRVVACRRGEEAWG